MSYNKPEEVAVIYHNKDMDGFCSGAICKMALEAQRCNVSLIGHDYSNPDLIILGYDRVIMVDVSMSLEAMMKFMKKDLYSSTIMFHSMRNLGR